MLDPAVVTALTTVAVGVLTAGAALAGQWLTQRTAYRQAEAARQAALRAERKAAYIDFFEAAQYVSRVIEQRRQSSLRDDAHAAELTHRMWLRQKTVALLANDEVKDAAHRFARMFADAVWDDVETTGDIWAYMDDAMSQFMSAVRKDLGSNSTTG
jgi:hypothetical protein